MSYLVLARKWRPQRFSEVLAQQHVVQALQNAVQLGRLPHALLLTGSRGIGKTTIARIIAKTVNCLNLPPNTERPDPCGQCSVCEEITNGRCVDVSEIDGASNRSIDDIRELRENVQYLPNHAHRKIYIIDEVHMLTREAFNALLKTLEEPPRHVLFIFATTEPHKIPVTILSRCQRFDFKRITTSELRQHLGKISRNEGIDLSETALSLLARAADGGVRDALSLLDQVIAFGGRKPTDEQVARAIGTVDRNLLREIGAALLNRDIQGCLSHIEQLLSHVYDIRQLIHELASFLRDLLVVAICKQPEDVTDLAADEIAAFRQLAAEQSPERIQQMFRILTRSAEDIARANHPRLLFEMTLIQMARVEPVRPFDEMLSHLHNLERRLRSLTHLPPTQHHPNQYTQPVPSNTPHTSSQTQQHPDFHKIREIIDQTPDQNIPANTSAPPETKHSTIYADSQHKPVTSSAATPSTTSPNTAYADNQHKLADVATSSIANIHTAEDAAITSSSDSTNQRSEWSEDRYRATLPDARSNTTWTDGGDYDEDYDEEENSDDLLQNKLVDSMPPGCIAAPVVASHSATQHTLRDENSRPVVITPISDDQWMALIQKYKLIEPFVSEAMQFARYYIADNTVQLIFPASDFFLHKRLLDQNVLTNFADFCAKEGHNIRIQFSLHHSDDLPAHYQLSLGEQQSAAQSQLRQEIDLEARQHPIITAILNQIPGAEIIRIDAIKK
jgi:DNA polymerase-3 subunit gamma/tau